MSFVNLQRWFGVMVLLCAAAAVSARAQAGVYATVTGERLSGLTCKDPQGLCAAPSGTAKPYGVNFGVQYDFRDYGPVRLGFDVRGTVVSANKRPDYYAAGTGVLRQYALLGGVRGSFATRFKVVRPYAEVAGGLGRANLDGTAAEPLTTYQNYGQVQAFVGADLKLFPVMDIRVIELSAGEMFGAGSHSIQSIGVGVVFHLSK